MNRRAKEAAVTSGLETTEEQSGEVFKVGSICVLPVVSMEGSID
jgi:hypothetical protein